MCLLQVQVMELGSASGLKSIEMIQRLLEKYPLQYQPLIAPLLMMAVAIYLAYQIYATCWREKVPRPSPSTVGPVIPKNNRAQAVYEEDDEKIIQSCLQSSLRNPSIHDLEKYVLFDFQRAVRLRRAILSRLSHTQALESSGLPYKDFDYGKVFGRCCENVIGYVTMPVGVAGPCLIDNASYYLPLATTEGCLVASTSRGCKAVSSKLDGKATGIRTVLLADGMARGPVLECNSIVEASHCRQWIESKKGYEIIRKAFDATSRYSRLQSIGVTLVGRLVFIRFKGSTGDAMGMNMISKATAAAIKVIEKECPDIRLISISGNYCTDKKASMVNFLEGRGKSVVADAYVPASVVKSVLKTSVDKLVKLNIAKNLIGSTIAGTCIGGNNCHAGNIVTALFIACGQDPAQNIESSNCVTLMESVDSGEYLYISCTMPCIEVGTVGGGTHLPSQAACLDLLGVLGPTPGDRVEFGNRHAQKFARVVCAAVLAAELSLAASLAENSLVDSHLTLNRAKDLTTNK